MSVRERMLGGLAAQLAKRIGLRGRLVGIMLKPMMVRAGEGDEAEHLFVSRSELWPDLTR
jgi:hypothetical protein